MKADSKSSGSPVWLHKILWFLLVIIVPLLAAAIMIGIALQVLGVPVWQTSLKYVGLGPRSTVQTPLQNTQTQLAIETAKVATMTQQQAKLQSQLNDALASEKSLQDQVAQLHDLLHGQADSVAQAKTEAAVLVGMDPAEAAGVLNKMSVDAAAAVVANMAPADAGQILGQLAPNTAAQILALAAQKQKAASVSLGDTTNGTSGSDTNIGNQTTP